MDSVRTLVVGIGSPHGRDEVGWILAERLKLRPGIDASICTLSEPTALLDHLADYQRLVIIDACRGGGPIGRSIRLQWPFADGEPGTTRPHSSHGLGLVEVLGLAEKLGRLPQQVVIWAIDIGSHSSQYDGNRLSQKALDRWEQQVLDELLDQRFTKV